jgi:hypothetical protein
MNTRRPTCLGLGLILLSLALMTAACQPGMLLGPKYTPTPTPTITPTPTPDPVILAGNWKAKTDFGGVDLTVAPDGKTINNVKYTFFIGNDLVMNMSFAEYDFSNYLFEDTTMIGQPPYEIAFRFKFNLDGKTGTVTWEGDLPSGKLEGFSEMLKTE